MRKEKTWAFVISNAASCVFVSPIAGWIATTLFPAKGGHPQGMVFVIIGVATLLGKDLIEGLLKEGDAFRADPRATMQAWLLFWKSFLYPTPPAK